MHPLQPNQVGLAQQEIVSYQATGKETVRPNPGYDSIYKKIEEKDIRNPRLRDTFLDTIKAIHDGHTIDPATVDAMQKGTVLFEKCPSDATQKGMYQTKFTIVNQDSLKAAKAFVDAGKNPLVLNFANEWKPGGGARLGTMGQEEELFRCTNYDDSLNPFVNKTLADQLEKVGENPLYHIPETGAILSPRVTVFRNGSPDYAFLEKTFEVGMLASAAYDLRPEKQGTVTASIMTLDYETGTKEKIRTQLGVAAKFGYTNLVLGAFGCGVFKNEPTKIAGWYNEILESEFPGVFEHITFAILVTKEAEQKNLQIFKETFRD